MHLAKGLKFRAVAVMACDDEIVPLQERIETVGDDADLREVYDTNVICSTSLAPVRGIISSLRVLIRPRNSLLTF